MTIDERTKLIQQLMLKITELFVAEIPPDTMKQPLGSAIMYDCILNYIYQLSNALDISEEKALADVKTIFEAKRQGDLN